MFKSCYFPVLHTSDLLLAFNNLTTKKKKKKREIKPKIYFKKSITNFSVYVRLRQCHRKVDNTVAGIEFGSVDI